MSKPRRYPPLAIVLHAFSACKVFVPLLFVYFFRKKELSFSMLLLFILIGLLLAFVVGGIRYYTHTYQIKAHEIVLYKGIFNKKQTVIPYERIQTIRQQQWFFLKPFGITSLTIDTGASGEKAEASMPAVKMVVLEELERMRLGKSEPVESVEQLAGYQMTAAQLLLFSLTEWKVFVGTVVIFGSIGQYITADLLDAFSQRIGALVAWNWVVVPVLAVVILLIIVGLATLRNAMHYYPFSVRRQANSLIIERGTGQQRVQSVALEKIQAVQIKQNILRKLFKVLSVELIIIGSEDAQEKEDSLYLIPLMKQEQCTAMLAELLPEYGISQENLPHVARASLFYFWRWPLLVYLVTLVGSYFLPGRLIIWGVLTIVCLFLLINQWLKREKQAFAIQQKQLIIQEYVLFTESQTYVRKNKIQALSRRSSYWLLKKRLGHLQFSIKKGNGVHLASLKYLHEEAMNELIRFYR